MFGACVFGALGAPTAGCASDEDGAAAPAVLTSSVPEPAGAHCPFGGTVTTRGPDRNRNW